MIVFLSLKKIAMSSFNDRIWCHFCKRFVMDKLLRIHKNSDLHKQNVEKCDQPPCLFDIPQTYEKSHNNDAIEILSRSDETIVISDDSGNTRESKHIHKNSFHPYQRSRSFICSVDDGSSCFPRSTTANYDSSFSISESESGDASDNETIYSETWSYSSQPIRNSYSNSFFKDENDCENRTFTSDIDECDEYRKDLAFPCGAWHYSQEFYDSCSWCNPKQ